MRYRPLLALFLAGCLSSFARYSCGECFSIPYPKPTPATTEETPKPTPTPNPCDLQQKAAEKKAEADSKKKEADALKAIQANAIKLFNDAITKTQPKPTPAPKEKVSSDPFQLMDRFSKIEAQAQPIDVEKLNGLNQALESTRKEIRANPAIDPATALHLLEHVEPGTFAAGQEKSAIAAAKKATEKLTTQTNEKIDDASTTANDANKDAKKADDSIANQLKGLHFGLGLGEMRLRHDDIIDTSVDGETKTLRVTNAERYKLGFWLETHLDLTEWVIPRSRLIPGIFVAVQVATQGDVLNAGVIGFQLAGKSKPLCDPDKNSINFGIGYGIARYQRLADGFTENMPLPAGATVVRYRKGWTGGPALIVSWGIL